MRGLSILEREYEEAFESDVSELSNIDPQRTRRLAVEIASMELPQFPIDFRVPGLPLRPGSFSTVWPRVARALGTIRRPNNANFVLRVLKQLSYSPGALEYFDPFLTVAIAARENTTLPFRLDRDSRHYHTYCSGGLDVIGSAILGGRLTEHHVPAPYLQRWQAYAHNNTTAINRQTGRQAPLILQNEQGQTVHATGLQKMDFLMAYGAFLIFRWDDQGILHPSELPGVGSSLSFRGTIGAFGFQGAQIAALTPLARRIWHALFFGGPGGARLGRELWECEHPCLTPDGRPCDNPCARPRRAKRDCFGARTILDFLQSSGRSLQDISRIAARFVGRRRMRSATSVALALKPWTARHHHHRLVTPSACRLARPRRD
jgi:hypothetical protein